MNPCDCILWIISCTSLILSIIAIIKIYEENFKSIKFPLAPTGQETLSRECPPNTQKCLSKTKNNQYYYFCSKDKNCNEGEFLGKPIEEPMAWPVRFA